MPGYAEPCSDNDSTDLSEGFIAEEDEIFVRSPGKDAACLGGSFSWDDCAAPKFGDGSVPEYSTDDEEGAWRGGQGARVGLQPSQGLRSRRAQPSRALTRPRAAPQPSQCSCCPPASARAARRPRLGSSCWCPSQPHLHSLSGTPLLHISPRATRPTTARRPA